MDIFNRSGRKIGSIENGESGGYLTFLGIIVVAVIVLITVVSIDNEREKHLRPLTAKEKSQRDSANKAYKRKVQKEINDVQKQHPEYEENLKKWEKRWADEKKKK